MGELKGERARWTGGRCEAPYWSWRGILHEFGPKIKVFLMTRGWSVVGSQWSVVSS